MPELISDVLFPESTVYMKMCKALTNPNLVKWIKKVSPSDQTSSLQGFHTVLNHFAPKMIHYSYPGMLCRLVFIKPNVAFFRTVLCLQYPNLIPLFLGTSMLMELSKWGLYTRSTRMVKRLWGMFVYIPILLSCYVLFFISYSTFVWFWAWHPTISQTACEHFYLQVHIKWRSLTSQITHTCSFIIMCFANMVHYNTELFALYKMHYISPSDKKLPVRQYDK